MRIFAQFSVVFCCVLTLVACSVPVEPAHIDVQTPHHIELSEGEELRQITINLAPGAIKRFRISTDQFVANLQQGGTTPARLSVKYYDLEASSQTEISPTVYAIAEDEAARNWTLRVHNEGEENLLATISVRGLVRDTEVPAAPRLDALRSYEISLDPGSSVRRRVSAVNLIAAFQNESQHNRAKLRLKNYELEYEVETVEPVVQTASNTTQRRNWTIVLTNVGEHQLEGTLSVYDRDTYIAFHESDAATNNIEASVVFSPQGYHQSHLPRIVEALQNAEQTIDVAMYSMSDSTTRQALGDAAERGVRVRVLFEGAVSDRKKESGTRSHHLEDMNVDVRYVNKILHHKYALIDGVEVDATGNSGVLISGSGNWSYGAASIYDENTLFIQGDRYLLETYQQEFNYLWAHSRDFEGGAEPISTDVLPIEIGESSAGSEAVFTSDNFSVYQSSRYGWTFRVEAGRNRVANRLIDLIMNAQESISIASGHMRSNAIAEALMAKQEATPDIEIRILLDGQEYVSESYNNTQKNKQAACLENAGDSESKRQKCLDVGFLYSYELSQSGLDLRFKYYAFRWDYSYAKQMHHKYMVIDDEIVATGSYNLSDNAEHNTFENVTILRADTYGETVAAYVDNFDFMWNRGNAAYDDFMNELPTLDVIPLVFDSMALTQPQVAELKRTIALLCPAVWSDEFRSNPSSNRTCDVLSQ